MTNPIGTITHDIEETILWPFKKLHIANIIVASALKDTPELRDAVTGLVQKIEDQANDITVAIAADGVNFAADAAALAQAKELYSYTTGTFIPAVKKAIEDIEASANSAKASPPPTAAAKAPKPPKPAAAPAAAPEPTAGTDEQGIQTPPTA